jgi:CRISPR-associated protein Cas2
MPAEGVRYMRLLVFFDLPVLTKEERRNASRFRNFLIADGYDMVQLSVYSRSCRGQEAADKHMHRLNGHLPPSGCVRALQMTEQQYGRMRILVGRIRPHEKTAARQLLLF